MPRLSGVWRRSHGMQLLPAQATTSGERSAVATFSRRLGDLTFCEQVHSAVRRGCCDRALVGCSWHSTSDTQQLDCPPRFVAEERAPLHWIQEGTRGDGEGGLGDSRRDDAGFAGGSPAV